MNRFFETAHHASLYARARPAYPDELFTKIFDFLDEFREPPHGVALDVACGTGMSTRQLAAYFERVVGTDVSENMIREAQSAANPDNVAFKVDAEGVFPLEDESLDLITIANGAHWVDKEKLYAETVRTLKPNGVLAMYGYGRPRLSCPHQPGSTVFEEFTEMIDFFMRKPSWPPATNDCFDKYRNYKLPFPECIRDDSFKIVCDWPLTHVLEYAGSIGGVQNFIKDNPDQSDIIVRYGEKFVQALPDPSEGLESVVRIAWDVFLLMGEKPSPRKAGSEKRNETSSFKGQ